MSWPAPEPGLVVRYPYLWRREQEAGREEATKDRPCAVILALAGEEGGRPLVAVLPITHSPPRPPTEGVELPSATKRRLGLDGERSWVVVSEANRFPWPGPDLRPLPGQGRDSAAYDVLPPDVFRAVRDRFLVGLRERRTAVVSRTEQGRRETSGPKRGTLVLAASLHDHASAWLFRDPDLVPTMRIASRWPWSSPPQVARGRTRRGIHAVIAGDRVRRPGHHRREEARTHAGRDHARDAL